MFTKVTFLLLLLASLLHLSAAKDCTANQISRMDVSACECAGTNTGCTSDCDICGPPLVTKSVKNCAKIGCADDQFNCTGCGIWFHTLCNCLKHPQTCQTSGTITPNGRPVWALLKSQAPHDNLVTTTEIIPGILQMGASESHDRGWTYAQENYDFPHQALWLNSVRARDMEQVHIHICNRSEATASILSQENIVSNNELIQLKNDPELYCMGIPHPTKITGFSSVLAKFLAKSPVCEGLIGAGMIHDNKNRIWACASTTHRGPKGKFC